MKNIKDQIIEFIIEKLSILGVEIYPKIRTLKKMGLIVGENFNPQQGCIIDPSHCWLIEIGNNVTLAPRVHILAHDASTKMFINYTKIGKVKIGNNVFVGAGTIVLPNVTIGDNVIVGAGSVVTNNIPGNSLAVGNPCRVIGSTKEYIEKNNKKLYNNPIYDESWTTRENISSDMKEKMKEELENKVGYIE